MPFHAADLDLIALATRQRRLQRAQRIERRALLIQRLDVQVGADLYLAGGRLIDTGQQLQQRGLARAVGTDDAQPIAAQHPQRQVLHNRGAAVITPGHMFGHSDQLAGHVRLGRRHAKAGLRAADVTPLLPQRAQFTQAADVALAPGGHAVAEPVFLPLDLPAQFMGIALGLRFHLVPPLLEMGKAAVDAPGRAAVEPYEAAGQRFQQAPVMADQHDAGTQRPQLLLQPLDGR